MGFGRFYNSNPKSDGPSTAVRCPDSTASTPPFAISGRQRCNLQVAGITTRGNAGSRNPLQKRGFCNWGGVAKAGVSTVTISSDGYNSSAEDAPIIP